MFGQAILALAESCPELLVLSADLGNSSGLDRFKQTYPERYLNVGIAEQNLIGVAGGLAKEGFTVFATSFAPFITMRAAEQIRMNLGYMGFNVKAVGIGSGLGMGFLGNSHYGLEDAAIMRSIPNLTVVSPADCGAIAKTVFAAASHAGPMYIRLTGAPNTPIVYREDFPFQLGRAISLREGGDVALVACGSMVHAALAAADLLAQEGIACSVTDMHTLKPLDTAHLDHLAGSARLLVTIEEHSRIGGLGSAVAEHLCAMDAHPPLLPIALPDAFGKSGEYAFLLDHYGLTPGKLAGRIGERYRRLAPAA